MPASFNFDMKGRIGATSKVLKFNKVPSKSVNINTFFVIVKDIK